MKATCVLITREKHYPKEVLDSLPDFDEVLIKTECPDVWTRYELALKAKNELIYVQDDDCLIDVLSLFKHHNGQITNAITQHHKDYYKGTGITLIGYGCFFPKKLVTFDRYTDKWGLDKLFFTQTDRIFTYLHQPHNSIVMDIKNLPRATDSTRMSAQPDHYINLEKIKEKLNLCER